MLTPRRALGSDVGRIQAQLEARPRVLPLALQDGHQAGSYPVGSQSIRPGQRLQGVDGSPRLADMEPTPPKTVSRDVIRAVLETRDHRHNETHAMLLALFQGLLAELVEQGVLAPEPLAQRLERSRAGIAPDPHGAAAHDILTHVVTWLATIEPGLPPAHPSRWVPAAPGAADDGVAAAV